VLADLAAVAAPSNYHNPLVKAAMRLRDLGLSVDDALADLLPLVPLHDEREARSTIRSAFRAPNR
jgi:hypothetical protein